MKTKFNLRHKEFDKLHPFTTFELNGQLYIKTFAYERRDSVSVSGGPDLLNRINAINLSEERDVYIAPHHVVRPVKGTFVEDEE